ncbi:glycosyltransferase family 4 protein [Caloramator proteoclasticus]|uniref:Glycosyltransferase involved in cell wall bisynthesis n=1 Tax=Caloramator proteoclasticus DSM 10124 TaxID=1121262 RepID=A0A1M4WL37_9CLOT|nr:glycosyltransferase family 4 protein [Caloramator proteoclasticus]SHE82021.1 Glycosyltransferase involved in cell wall bisynthesis [Caloramator proteoclasticus DSM 10124]
MKKALIFASVASMIDQFNMHNIQILQELGYQVDVACNFEFGSTTSQERVKEFKDELKNIDVNIYHIPVPRKVDAIKDIAEAYKKTERLISQNKYDIVHCHSPIGGVIARLACKKHRKNGTKVIYTVHGFHFFSGAPLKNWVIFYPIERWLSRYTDVLITINKEDYNRAKKLFRAGMVEYVPGVGVNIKKFNEISVDRIQKRKELGIPEGAFLVLSVGELNKNKNHETIIKAIAKLQNPNVYYMICGQGVLEDYLKNLAKGLGLEKQVKLLGYRRDIAEIGKVSDVFVLPSFREGLSVALMEAMALGLPIVCSKIRGNVDLIEDGKGGYLVEVYDVEQFANSINKLLENVYLNNKMGKHNRVFIKKFDIENVKKIMREIYNTV